MAATKARADCSDNSTATLADGPPVELRKSMFSQWSTGACTGWLKYTIALVTGSYSSPPLPLLWDRVTNSVR